MTSKHSLKQRLERIDKDRDYPFLSLCELIAADEIEDVESANNRDLVCIDGEIYDGTELLEAMRDL